MGMLKHKWVHQLQRGMHDAGSCNLFNSEGLRRLREGTPAIPVPSTCQNRDGY